MPDFRIGQKVVCVFDKPYPPIRINGNLAVSAHLPLKEGEIYVIRDIRVCFKCGKITIDVGFNSNNGTMCPCGQVYNEKGWFFGHERFRPLDDMDIPEEHLDEVEQLKKLAEEPMLVPVELEEEEV